MKDINTNSGARELFTDLFVLEVANNHWGSVERGKEIIRQHAAVVKKHSIKAAIKFQFRDVDSFVHEKYVPHNEISREGEIVEAPGSSSRYIKKTIATKLSKDGLKELVDEVKRQGMVTMATPFDEKSVSMFDEFDIDIIKIASQDAKAWTLIEKISAVGRPTMISNGGTDIEDLDKVVAHFKEKGTPLAINHCVSLYPSEDNELEINQIDFLKTRFPDNVIGFSTHEYSDWASSVMIAYAKGARSFERHVDIEDTEGTPVSKYCSLPEQVDSWFRAFLKAKEMCGSGGDSPRNIKDKEKNYVASVARGVYAIKDLPKGYVLTRSGLGVDYKLTIPLQDNQISARDLDSDIILSTPVKKGDPILIPN